MANFIIGGIVLVLLMLAIRIIRVVDVIVPDALKRNLVIINLKLKNNHFK